MRSHLAMELAKIPIKANRWYKSIFDWLQKSTKVSQIFGINRDRNLGDFEISQLKGHLKSKSKSNDKSMAEANQCNYKQKSNWSKIQSRVNHDESFGHGISKNSDKGQSMVQKKIRLISKVNKSQSSLSDKSRSKFGWFRNKSVKGTFEK